MNASAGEGVRVLAGATCSGKTALAIELAERFDAEIVGADSRQLYRGMSIGTAAPTAADTARVPHHLVAFLDPHERYSAARYALDALVAIRAIRARGKRAIVAGGTGFYIRALAGDVRLSAAYDEAVRARIAREARTHPPDVLHAWLAARDPARAAALHAGDRYRVARALEIALAPPSETRAVDVASLRSEAIPYVKVALEVERDEIDARIAARVATMLAAGLLDEAERIGADAVAADAVGYPQALAFLDGLASRAALSASLTRATRRYARRQITWFAREPDVVWLAAHAVAETARTRLGWHDRRMRSEPT
ncbi:MAG: tRNA (adenosine(37)-N6)-dimethylallyltransferase MiaA [Candidatus Eremiobacteraeota bacterium]|nr:tRNA (adenosine(37)-N6)-dimethylallyltransferase MiaA [Candidatus Eremiobacteraeota bacterium]